MKRLNQFGPWAGDVFKRAKEGVHDAARIEPNEPGIVRDLNNAWYTRCLEWLKMGLDILDDAHITADHKASRDAVLDYLKTHDNEPTLGGVLILDAVTVHDAELNRISRTLR
jgi:hypothetical protein